MQAFAESLPKLVESGVQVPVYWVNEKLQIPLPKAGEAVLGMVQAQANKTDNATGEPDQAPAPTATQAKLKSLAITKLVALKAKSDSAQNQDTADLFAQQLANGYSPMLQSFNEEIEALINGADSLEALQEQLSTMDLSIDEASEVLQLALVAAELGGMAEVADGV
jgi:phage gp29-like protein